MTRQALTPVHGVSVICPVKDLIKNNRSVFFQRLIESYIESRCAETELVIVEGEHSDQTAELVADLAGRHPNDKIICIKEEKNGIYAAINAGARAATKDGLIFLGSDDHFLPNGINEILRAARKDYAEYYYWTQAVSKNGRYELQGPKSPSRVLFGNFFCFQSFLIKRDTFISIGGFSEEFSICSDYDLALRLVESGRVGKKLDITATAVDRNGASSDTHKFMEEYTQVLSRRLNFLIGPNAQSANLVQPGGRVKSEVYLRLIRRAPNRTLRVAAFRGLVRNFENLIKRSRIV